MRACIVDAIVVEAVNLCFVELIVSSLAHVLDK